MEKKTVKDMLISRINGEIDTNNRKIKNADMRGRHYLAGVLGERNVGLECAKQNILNCFVLELGEWK
jgi:hypothetical protein